MSSYADTFKNRVMTKPVDILFRKEHWKLEDAKQEMVTRGLFRGSRRVNNDPDHHTFALAREHELVKPMAHGACFTMHPFHLCENALVRCVTWVEPRIRGRGKKNVVVVPEEETQDLDPRDLSAMEIAIEDEETDVPME